MIRRPQSTSPRRRPAVSRLDGQLGYWLLTAANRVSRTLSRDIWDKGITLTEWLVLRELYDGERRPAELAQQLGLTRGALSKLADRLVAHLMITQQSGTGDGRARVLALTDLGRATVPVLALSADHTEKVMFGDLNPDTRALMVAVLREIVRRHDLRAVPAD